MKYKYLNLSPKNIHITADLHLGHGNIIRYCKRYFCTTNEEKSLIEQNIKFKVNRDTINYHDSYILDKINKQVAHDDVLIIAGDYCFGRELYNTAKYYRERIVCKNIFLVYGNHDEECIDDFFSYSNNLLRIKVNGIKFLISHSAFAIWEDMHKGCINLYGHSHTTAEKGLDKLFPERRSGDVGIDNAKLILGEYRPFTFDEIINWLGNRKGRNLDHHE